MRNLFGVILAVAACFLVYRWSNLYEQKIEGKWRGRVQVAPGDANILLDFQPGGTLTGIVDAAADGQVATFQLRGRWQATFNRIRVDLDAETLRRTRLKAEPLGGKIIYIGNRQMTIESRDGKETWYRVGGS